MQIKDYDTLVLFDTETTGFDAKQNRIIELAAIRVDKDGERRMDEFIRLPEGQRVPQEVVELTHITDEMLQEQGKSESEVARMFAELIAGEKVLLIAHNAQFDLNFIGWTFVRYFKEHPEWNDAFNKADYLDTLTVYKDRRKYPHKLANAIEAYGLGDKVQNSHRAIDDVLALLEVTKAMQAERPDLADYINIIGYNAKYGVSGSTLKKITYHSQGFRDYMAQPEQTLPAIIQNERR